MAKKKAPLRLGHLQLAVLKSLWHRETATVTDVHGDLQASLGLAPTTVATVLRRMEMSGLVSHTENGRQYVYRAEITDADVAESATEDVLDRLFAGKLSEMVSQVLNTRDISPKELDELTALIAAKKRESKSRQW